MKHKNTLKQLAFGLVLCLLLIPSYAFADDFADYNTTAGQSMEFDLPEIDGDMWGGVVFDFFPLDTADDIGPYEAAGRGIVATGTTIYLQKNYGTSVWIPVATTTDAMDPSFIHVSPDGSKVALGIGWGKDLVIIPTSTLDPDNPPNVQTDTSCTVYSGTSVDYYDAEWMDVDGYQAYDKYLLLDGGLWPGPPYGSKVGVLDTDNPSATAISIIDTIPGASAGVTIDNNGNVYTGNGYDSAYGYTGQIKIFFWTDIKNAIDTATPLIYATLDGSGNETYSDGVTIADNVLSAANLGFDSEGNLYVGGGSFVDPNLSENGYVALIHNSVISAIAAGTRTTPVNEALPGEYKTIVADSCMDDSAAFVSYNSWGKGLAYVWNPTGDEANGGACFTPQGCGSDYWEIGVTPKMTIYTPSSAPDTDGDGVHDVLDNAYMTVQTSAQFVDSDDDGWANIVDADLNNDGLVTGTGDWNTFQAAWNTSNPHADFNGDGFVTGSDFTILNNLWGSSEPWY